MALPCISTSTTNDGERSGKSGGANLAPSSRTVDLARREGGRRGSDIRDRLPLGWAHLAPYFLGIWAFGTRHAERFGTWAIGWILLWVSFSPAALWTGFWVGDACNLPWNARPSGDRDVVFFGSGDVEPDLRRGGLPRSLPRVLIGLAMFIGVVAVLYRWNTVAHSWQAVFGG
jgi:hypothetical protein